jgi:hypothetical protein
LSLGYVCLCIAPLPEQTGTPPVGEGAPGYCDWCATTLAAAGERLAEITRLCAALAQATRHDCEAWGDEGLACAQCNPTAIALREAWEDDPVRVERDELRAKLESAEQRAAHVQAETWRCAAAIARSDATSMPWPPVAADRLNRLADQLEQRAAAPKVEG